MINLINGFARRGLEVHLALPPGHYPELTRAVAGVRIHYLEARDDAAGVRHLREFLERLDPRAVLANRDNARSLLARATPGLARRPLIAFRVGIHIPAKLRHKNPLGRWRACRELARAYRSADLLIGNSRGVCEGLHELLGERAPPIHAIYNPLDLATLRQQADEPLRHPWFREPGAPLLVSVGRLAGMKDQATLLRAFARLPGDYRLVILGEGRQRPKLQALAERLGVAERFDLPGHVANPFPYLARADLFVLSSRFEGSPNALLEALAVGTPAVATDCPSGPREILADGRYGALVPVGDADALAEAIEQTLARPPSPELLRQAVERFDLEQAVTAYLRVMGQTHPEET
jgi:glycosyltransferase involved in cell wall biosynthesis